jgi:hypothetical protein
MGQLTRKQKRGSSQMGNYRHIWDTRTTKLGSEDQVFCFYYKITSNATVTLTLWWSAENTYLISEIEKYVWYAKVKVNDFASALLFLIREVSIRSPPGPSAILRRYSKLQWNNCCYWSIWTHRQLCLASTTNTITKKIMPHFLQWC